MIAVVEKPLLQRDREAWELARAIIGFHRAIASHPLHRDPTP